MVNALDWYAGGLPFESSILPLLKHSSDEQWPSDRLAIKGSAGVASEMNFREGRSTSLMSPPSVNKAAHSGLKPRANVTWSPKQGHQWPHKKICPPEFFKKSYKAERMAFINYLSKTKCCSWHIVSCKINIKYNMWRCTDKTSPLQMVLLHRERFASNVVQILSSNTLL